MYKSGLHVEEVCLNPAGMHGPGWRLRRDDKVNVVPVAAVGRWRTAPSSKPRLPALFTPLALRAQSDFLINHFTILND